MKHYNLSNLSSQRCSERNEEVTLLSLCEEHRLGLSQLNDGIDRRRVPPQNEDHPGNDPQLVPGFPRLCSGMFPERFRSASVSVGSR